MTLLGYHIDGLELANNTSIKEQVKRTRSNWHLVLDDKQYARDLLPHTRKGIIYRAFDPFSEVGRKGDFDNDFWQRHTAHDTALWMKANLGDMQEFYLTAGNNEPSSSPANRKDFIRWLTQLMHELKAVGLHGAIGEIAVAKTLEIDEIKQGWWDEFLTALYEYRDWHILTFHEYTTGVLPASHIVEGGGYPYNLLDRKAMNKANWIAKMPLAGYPGNWHLGRWHWLRERAIAIGKPIKRVVITECAFDIMENPGASGEYVRNTLKPMFGSGRFERLKGWEGHKPYWKWLLDTNIDTVWQEFMYDNYAWYANACADEVEGLCIFALNPDWYETEGVDLSQPGVDFFRALVETRPVIRAIPAPIPVPTPMPRTLRPIRMQGRENTINLRDKPSITANKIGELPVAPTVTAGFVEVGDGEYIKPHTWKWYEFKDASGKDLKGYMASDLIAEVTSEPPSPQPDYKALAIEILEKVREELDSDIAQKIAQKMVIDRQLAELKASA